MYAKQLSTVLSFGKHKGKTIKQILESDPTYIEWCLLNIEGFELDKAANQRLELELDWLEDM